MENFVTNGLQRCIIPLSDSLILSLQDFELYILVVYIFVFLFYLYFRLRVVITATEFSMYYYNIINYML